MKYGRSPRGWWALESRNMYTLKRSRSMTAFLRYYHLCEREVLRYFTSVEYEKILYLK